MDGERLPGQENEDQFLNGKLDLDEETPDQKRLRLAQQILSQTKKQIKKQKINDDFFQVQEDDDEQIQKNENGQINLEKNYKNAYFQEDEFGGEKQDDDSFQAVERDHEFDNVTNALQENLLKKKNLIYNMYADKIAEKFENGNYKTIQLKGHKKNITCMQFDPSKQFLYSASKDTSIIKWDIETQKKQFISLGKGFDKTGHTGEILSMSVNFDGKFMVTAGKDRSIKLWDLKSEKLIETFKGHKNTINAVKFGLNSNNFVSGSSDRTFKIWDASERAFIDTLYGHKSEVLAIDACTQDNFISSGYDKQNIYWKTELSSQLIFQGHDYPVDCVKGITFDHYLSGCQDGTVGLWSIKKKRPLYTVRNAHGENKWITALGNAFNTDVVCSGSHNQKLNFYKIELNQKKLIKLFELDAPGIVNDIQFTHDCSMLAYTKQVNYQQISPQKYKKLTEDLKINSRSNLSAENGYSQEQNNGKKANKSQNNIKKNNFDDSSQQSEQKSLVYQKQRPSKSAKGKQGKQGKQYRKQSQPESKEILDADIYIQNKKPSSFKRKKIDSQNNQEDSQNLIKIPQFEPKRSNSNTSKSSNKKALNKQNNQLKNSKSLENVQNKKSAKLQKKHIAGLKKALERIKENKSPNSHYNGIQIKTISSIEADEISQNQQLKADEKIIIEIDLRKNNFNKNISEPEKLRKQLLNNRKLKKTSKSLISLNTKKEFANAIKFQKRTSFKGIENKEQITKTRNETKNKEKNKSNKIIISSSLIKPKKKAHKILDDKITCKKNGQNIIKIPLDFPEHSKLENQEKNGIKNNKNITDENQFTEEDFSEEITTNSDDDEDFEIQVKKQNKIKNQNKNKEKQQSSHLNVKDDYKKTSYKQFRQQDQALQYLDNLEEEKQGTTQKQKKQQKKQDSEKNSKLKKQNNGTQLEDVNPNQQQQDEENKIKKQIQGLNISNFNNNDDNNKNNKMEEEIDKDKDNYNSNKEKIDTSNYNNIERYIRPHDELLKEQYIWQEQCKEFAVDKAKKFNQYIEEQNKIYGFQNIIQQILKEEKLGKLIQDKIQNADKQAPAFKIKRNTQFQMCQIRDDQEQKKYEKKNKLLKQRLQNFSAANWVDQKQNFQKFSQYSINQTFQNIFMPKDQIPIKFWFQFENFIRQENKKEQQEENQKILPILIQKEKTKQEMAIQYDKLGKEKLEIVANNNQKITIEVNINPFASAASSGMGRKTQDKTKDPLENIINRFDKETRDLYFGMIPFTKDYKQGYEPINIQQQQEQDLRKNTTIDQEKNHFIRKKQSTASVNLKRTCGVSYVKPTESEQLNISHIYDTLPPLVYQCSSGCERLEQFEMANGKFFLLKNMNQLWPFFIDKMFLCIHLFFDYNNLLKSPNLKDLTVDEIKQLVELSDVQIGLLFKKSLSGRKAFIKSLGEFIAEKREKLPKVDKEKLRQEKEEKRKEREEEKANRKKEREIRKEQRQQELAVKKKEKERIKQIKQEEKEKMNILKKEQYSETEEEKKIRLEIIKKQRAEKMKMYREKQKNEIELKQNQIKILRLNPLIVKHSAQVKEHFKNIAEKYKLQEKNIQNEAENLEKNEEEEQKTQQQKQDSKGQDMEEQQQNEQNKIEIEKENENKNESKNENENNNNILEEEKIQDKKSQENIKEQEEYNTLTQIQNENEIEDSQIQQTSTNFINTNNEKSENLEKSESNLNKQNKKKQRKSLNPYFNNSVFPRYKKILEFLEIYINQCLYGENLEQQIKQEVNGDSQNNIKSLKNIEIENKVEENTQNKEQTIQNNQQQQNQNNEMEIEKKDQLQQQTQNNCDQKCNQTQQNVQDEKTQNENENKKGNLQEQNQIQNINQTENQQQSSSYIQLEFTEILKKQIEAENIQFDQILQFIEQKMKEKPIHRRRSTKQLDQSQIIKKEEEEKYDYIQQQQFKSIKNNDNSQLVKEEEQDSPIRSIHSEGDCLVIRGCTSSSNSNQSSNENESQTSKKNTQQNLDQNEEMLNNPQKLQNGENNFQNSQNVELEPVKSENRENIQDEEKQIEKNHLNQKENDAMEIEENKKPIQEQLEIQQSVQNYQKEDIQNIENQETDKQQQQHINNEIKLLQKIETPQKEQNESQQQCSQQKQQQQDDIQYKTPEKQGDDQKLQQNSDQLSSNTRSKRERKKIIPQVDLDMLDKQLELDDIEFQEEQKKKKKKKKKPKKEKIQKKKAELSESVSNSESDSDNDNEDSNFGEKKKKKKSFDQQQQQQQRKRVSNTTIDYNKLKNFACGEVMEYIEREEDSKTINTLSSRLELYVDREKWLKADQFTRDLLNSFILQTQDNLMNYSLQMMNTRFKVYKQKDINQLEDALEEVREIYKEDTDIIQNQYQYS
ncbi:WD40-repeat-containing domain [Pseudocohnilembus persalinus]|uniref:WD40-repeat-containing domain n=1 Tax=Pseudocohnilembus persalinus TaxID=266149 RepID=A0A0V0QMM6_PSEPJ|nr:WD40-repeat-containing domain [Pseudocohnilembus persalinus]|eukprot:KRX03609.1 WD40-repeat-containing domain [Pseudocohnilembus persalinus]